MPPPLPIYYLGSGYLGLNISDVLTCPLNRTFSATDDIQYYLATSLVSILKVITSIVTKSHSNLCQLTAKEVNLPQTYCTSSVHFVLYKGHTFIKKHTHMAITVNINNKVCEIYD